MEVPGSGTIVQLLSEKAVDAIANENNDKSLLETISSFFSFDPFSLGESTTRLTLVSKNTHRTVMSCWLDKGQT